MAENTGKIKKLYNWILLAIIVGVVVFLNIIGTFLYSRIDMTEDERYSLSSGSIEFLEKMNTSVSSKTKKKGNRLFLKIYLEGKLPAEIKRFRNAVEDKLEEFKEIAGDRIEFQFIDPLEGTEAEKDALFQILYNKGKGIVPLEIVYQKDGSQSQMILWPGAEIEYDGFTKNYIQLLPGSPQGQPAQLSKEFSETTIQNSINNLEYMLISALRRTIQKQKPRIAFLGGHGELGFPETQRVRTLLEPYYSIEDLNLNDSLKALDGFTGVIIARPRTAYTDKDLYIIDQFVMRGGRLMCFFDKLTFPQDSLNRTGMTSTVRTNLGLDKLLFDYGIKTNDNYVMDVRCAPIQTPFAKQSLLPWFFYVAATPTKHPIARNIEPVMLRYVSQIQLIPGDKRLVSPILTSSTNSRVSVMAPMLSLAMPMNYGKVPVLADNPTSEANKICVAGMSEGRFDSHFKNRLIDEFSKNPESGFITSSKEEGKVLVVTNGSFIANYYDSMPSKTGKMMYRPISFNNLRYDEVMAQMRMQPLIYGNQEFFQNIVDYMMGDNSVLDIRSKQIDIHPIDKEKVKNQRMKYILINVALPSLLIILLAILLFYLRRRRYARS
ncbi:Gldg family protein [Fluviicola sp.]|uniref:GldG family protein n=1 Tax=Fluviicola sp. TaxID=1917219 RepID=UPI0026062FC4|nr:Gldg family protein [Fluviicola sp.]